MVCPASGGPRGAPWRLLAASAVLARAQVGGSWSGSGLAGAGMPPSAIPMVGRGPAELSPPPGGVGAHGGRSATLDGSDLQVGPAPASWHGQGQPQMAPTGAGYAGGLPPQAGAMGLQLQPPLVVGGVEFSREDDLENVEKISNLYGQVFYASVLQENDAQVQEAWRGLQADIWALAQHAAQEPALALGVSMVFYNYFWWEGPHSVDVNARAGYLAAELMYIALGFGGCRDWRLPDIDFFIRQCPMRWRYLLMIAGEVGRHLVLQRRNLQDGGLLLRHLRTCFDEMRRLPQLSRYGGLLHLPHAVNFNSDYFPAVVARQGPIWRDPLRDVPIARLFEENYATIRGELDAILAKEGTFERLDELTRNAETQFGPRGDDWLTAYMVRGAQWFDAVCAHAPRTCALLRSRPELADCHKAGSGAGFLRMRPGGRLKPHFGNAPRITVHLGLVVPEHGELHMSVGYETVKWQEGRAFVFDDTFIHTVTHNGVEPRYVMLAWICHPCDGENGKRPGEPLPDYCSGPPGPMTTLGLQPLPPRAQQR